MPKATAKTLIAMRAAIPRADDWEWSFQSWPWFRLDSVGEALAPSVALLR
jgi:hypothetical protein